MSPLTALVFLLALGSMTCFGDKAYNFCMKREGVTKKDLRYPTQQNVKCYFYCLYKMKGVIVNGSYVGNQKWCRNIEDSDKCELGLKVHYCSMLRTGL